MNERLKTFEEKMKKEIEIKERKNHSDRLKSKR